MAIMQINVKKTVSAALVTSAIVLTGCASSSVTKVVNAAPITYKAANASVQYAAVTATPLPRSSKLPMGTPSVAIPSPYIAPAPRPKQARPQVDNFDSKGVDRDLYKHQKVGKKYKVMGKSYTPKHDPKYDKKGLASWYGDKYHGKPTATGEIFDKNAMTAAHKTLPLNSMLHVTNLETGKSMMVRLNDRGPFVKGRIIDLSEAVARELGVLHHGTARVRVRYAGPADPMAPNRMVAAPQAKPMPMPYRPSPQAGSSVSAPQQAAPEYQPLREHTPQAYIPQEYAPQEYAPAQPTAPAPRSAEEPRYHGPESPAPQPPIPLPVEPATGNEDDVITLTIKGPIHMAKAISQSDQNWIAAVNTSAHPK